MKYSIELLFIILLFLANTIEGITGFAGTMLAMPYAIRLLGMQEAKSVLNILAILVSSLIFIRNYKETDKKELLKISVFMFIGMLIGLLLFTYCPVDILQLLYGAVIVVLAVKGLFIQKQCTLSEKALTAVIIAAGIVHGMFLSGGALLVIYAMKVLKDKAKIRATLAPVWILLNTFMLSGDILSGRLTQPVGRYVLIGIIPILLALKLGSILHNKIDQKIFAKLTYILLIISGITLFF